MSVGCTNSKTPIGRLGCQFFAVCRWPAARTVGLGDPIERTCGVSVSTRSASILPAWDLAGLTARGKGGTTRC